ncbi:MAG: putative ATPase/glycosyltransferase involved in cell wall biosynthesis, partial [Phenylobacterium sp.]
MKPAFSLITFASYWGSQYGGINAFNADFLEAMGIAYEGKVNVVCVVNSANDKDVEDAKGKQVTLVALPYNPSEAHMGQAQALAAIGELGKQGITFNSQNTIWLGHDRITGEAALVAAKQAGGRAALIHHMSYDHYEAFAENATIATIANDKRNHQKSLFNDADILMAVGPLLRDALEDMVDGEVNMIIPGLAAIEPKKKSPNSFSMFVSGRLSKDASKIKQGQLAVAAFADCYKQAKQQGQPEAILKRPKLLMRGVNFDLTAQDSDHYSASEENLQKFAEGYADAVINLQPLPYTTDREQLFKDLKSASVAAMPSWHEGFGLVGWEAIAAGVPLILSKDSGVYELIAQNHSGFEQSHVWGVAIAGKTDDPYFADNDLTNVSEAIKQIAQDPGKAREKAERLRLELLGYTWDKCAKNAVGFFDWNIAQHNNTSTSTSTHLKHIKVNGFKSIHSLDLQMGAINILIGANGAGKSNFISLFSFLRNLGAGKLQRYVEKQGFADTFFHFGAKHTPKISIDLAIGHHGYHVEFSHGANDDNLLFEQEFCTYSASEQQWPIKKSLSEGKGEWRGESALAQPIKRKSALTPVLASAYMDGCRVYHFHDTGANAGFKQATDLDAADYLYDDASNIAALLYRLKNEYLIEYQEILVAIQTVTPFFHDFYLEPRGEPGKEKLILKWIHSEHDTPFSANQLSDGTARFICMATLFLQPQTLKPNTIIIDEPELGIHPTALDVLADMVKFAAKSSQVICSTQSVTFANQFEPEDFIVVDQVKGASGFKRPDPVALAHWL